MNSPEIRDGKLIDDHAQGQPQGVYFPSASSYPLYDYNYSANGRAYCNGQWRFDNPPIDAANKCHRALPYTRSRKGANNNDWIRSSRQQTFIYAAIKAVSSSELSGLASTASNEGGGRWMTNMPISLSNAQDLYNRLHNASLGHRVVFKPNGYATQDLGHVRLPAEAERRALVVRLVPELTSAGGLRKRRSDRAPAQGRPLRAQQRPTSARLDAAVAGDQPPARSRPGIHRTIGRLRDGRRKPRSHLSVSAGPRHRAQ